VSRLAVTVKTGKALTSLASVKQALSPNSPEMRAGFRQVTVRYSAFSRRRFNEYSRGAGDWTPLAKSTVDARRQGGGVSFGGGRKVKGRKVSVGRGGRSSLARDTRKGDILVSAGGTFSILRDKGFLFNALTIGVAGNRVTDLPNGIAFGFSDAPHGGASLSIGQLAAVHHFGVPQNHIPARRILVQPDAATLRLIRNDLAAAARKAVARATGGKP